MYYIPASVGVAVVDDDVDDDDVEVDDDVLVVDPLDFVRKRNVKIE